MIFLVSDKDNWVLQLQSCSFVQPTACFLTLSLPLKLICFRQEIRSATSSMTSVLKPLKFLFSHFGTLQSYFETITSRNVWTLWITQLRYVVDWFGAVLMTPFYCFAEVHGWHTVSVSFDNVHWRRKRMCFRNSSLPTVIYKIFCLTKKWHLQLFLWIWNWDIFLFQESLKYRLLGSEGDMGSWEHEYVRYGWTGMICLLAPSISEV